MFSLKEIAIREYMSKVDWKRDNWSYNTIEEDMRRFLGERPSLEVKYQKDVMVNEFTGESREITKIAKINVIYTDLDEKIKKLEFIID
jgi:hypothetical protein